MEIASDLSTEAFFSRLRRFIFSEGKPSDNYCDNSRNFVGADNELRQFIESHNKSIASFAAGEGIDFKFSPAYSPYFGGLWEAGLKSAKFRIVRMLGNSHLMFEKLSTFFAQVETI